MFLKLTRWIVSLCALGLLPIATTARAETDAATAEWLMRKSGFWDQLAGLAPQVRAGFGAALARANPGEADSPEARRVKQLIDTAYGAPRLRATSRDALAQRVDAAQVPALQRWYDSELGQRVSALEARAASDARDPQEVLREGRVLADALTPQRRQLIDDFIAATRSADVMVSISVNTLMALQAGVGGVMPEAVGLEPNQMRAMLEAQRPEMLKNAAELSLAMYAKTYDSLPTADLASYVAFLQSREGRHFNDVGVEALDAALIEAATEFGREVARGRPQPAS